MSKRKKTATRKVRLSRHDRQRLASRLLEARRQAIIDLLLENPVCQVEVYMDPVHEDSRESTSLGFGVVQGARGWEVWGYDQEAGLTLDDTFASEAEATARALAWADETETQAVEYLDEQKDLEWEKDFDPPMVFHGPFTFSDTTDFRQPLILETEDDVFDFFDRRDWLFRPDEWGNLYGYSLWDTHGFPCQVIRSNRGKMRLATVQTCLD